MKSDIEIVDRLLDAVSVAVTSMQRVSETEIKTLQAEVNNLREEMQKVVTAYDTANPVRTADFHKENCPCLRCAIDQIRY